MANPWDPLPVPPAFSEGVVPYNPGNAPYIPPETQQGYAPGLTPGGFSTGYPGASPGGGSLTGGMGGQPQFPWQAYQGAWDQAQQAAGRGGQALMGGLSVSSPFGVNIGNMFANPQGFSPEEMRIQQQRLAQTEAGSRENALMRMQQRMAASGFGNDSASGQFAQGQLRAQSANNLSNQQNDLYLQNEAAKRQQQQSFAQIMANLYGIDAGLRGQYAGHEYGRQFPIMPGQQGGMGGMQGGGQQTGWGAQQGPWYNQQGQYQSGARPYDPFTQGQGNRGAAGGWTPQNPYQPW